MNIIISFLKKIILIFDLLFIPLILFSAFILKIYRKLGVNILPSSTKVLKKIGIFPIINHYYEPLFIFSNLKKTKRNLPGISFNINNQIELLNKLNFQNEFKSFLFNENDNNNFKNFSLNNGNIENGDAEFLYQIIRYLKPSKVIEIGCGESTKIIMLLKQIKKKIKILSIYVLSPMNNVGLKNLKT